MSDQFPEQQPASNQPPPPPPPPSYGQQPYGQPAYGQQPYGQPYGHPAYGAADGMARYGAGAYAHWGLRVGAALIDGLIPGIAWVILSGVVSASGSSGAAIVVLVIGYLAALAFYIWNTCIRQGRTGQTIGKSALNIRLIRESDGQPVGAGLAFGRSLLHIVDALPCYLGYFWPIWDDKKQTFADKIVSTVVVRV
jgi:uncharacterized RDD family membrane protein YckC